ncbi:hypothetical protein ACQPW3_35165 [Actinosynnema sp. CA-248983]
MIKRFAASLAAIAAVLGVMVVAAPAAHASNVSTDRCTRLYVEYTSSGSTRTVYWAEATNVCSPYWGFHNVGGETGPTQTQGSYRKKYGGVNYQQGNRICAISWKHISGSHFEEVGRPCTLLA